MRISDWSSDVCSSDLAGGGLGRAHALLLASRGAKIVVNDLGGATDGTGESISAAQKVVEDIEAIGGEAVANGASVTDYRAVEAKIGRASCRERVCQYV